MSRQGDFLIYCVETYKNAKHLTGRQVAELFTRYRVWDYVYSCYEALHTTGGQLYCGGHRPLYRGEAAGGSITWESFGDSCKDSLHPCENRPSSGLPERGPVLFC